MDTRLYISVRPFLEYEIPDVAHVVHDALLGDVPVAQAKREVQRLKETPACTGERIAPSSMDNDVGDLSAHCMRVVNHAVEHVRQLEREWVEFLRRVSTGLRKETRSIRRDASEAQRIYERYNAMHPAITAREFQNERNALQRRLDDAVEAYRTAAPPSVPRPEALRVASQDPREAFANAYGRVSTRTLMALRQHFESELAHAQVEIVRSYCRHCIDVLQG